MMHLVGDKPFHKTAAGKKQARRLAAYASLVESEVQVDVLLAQDGRLKHDPSLRAAVKAEILRVNPKLQEGAHGE